MKVLVTGADGQLGRDLIKHLIEQNIDYMAAGKNVFDIIDYNQVEEVAVKYQPNVIIHCAAYSKVDLAEENPTTCMEVNVKGTENIAKICGKINAKMIFISTDYVFSGDKDKPYEVDEFTKPLSVYGKSKLDAEKIVQRYLHKYFIVRISWLFGSRGNNFVRTIIKLAKEKSEINVVNDQIGSPTYTKDLSQFLVELARTNKYGIYHATNEGFCSWAEFAETIIKFKKMTCKINGTTSEEYMTRAVRPKNSRLSKASIEKNGFKRLPRWEDALNRYLNEIVE